MAVTVRIANWNVQNFGPLKSGLEKHNYDVVNAVATAVLTQSADLFALLEVNTTDPITTRRICGIMRNALAVGAAAMGRRDEFKTCVLSPVTGIEAYAFFIRDNWSLVPLPIAGPAGPGGAVPTLLGPGGVAIQAAQFAPLTNPDGVAGPWFPLIEPDVPNPGAAKTRSGGAVYWPRRKPVFAPFWVRGASARNRVLPILACHYEGEGALAARQLPMMRYFSFLRGLCGPLQPQPGAPDPPVALLVQPPGEAQYMSHTPNYGLLLGDFNVDYRTEPQDYSALTGNGAGQLGMTVQNTLTRSILLTLENFHAPLYRTTEDLYVHVYDNFLTRNRPGVAAPTAASFQGRYNHAQGVRDHELRLRETLEYHDRLGQRGVPRVLNELTAPPGRDPPSVRAGFVGARVISDHAPVFLDLTLN